MKRILFLALLGCITAVTSYWVVLHFRKTTTYKSYVVQSGSMEPSIRVGDVIIIHKNPEYFKTEVITFKDEEQHTVTHRILESTPATTPVYITKGDANQAADTAEVPQKNVIGKVVLVVPKIGYAIQFIRTPWGLILTILVPAILILSDEIKTLYRSLR